MIQIFLDLPNNNQSGIACDYAEYSHSIPFSYYSYTILIISYFIESFSIFHITKDFINSTSAIGGTVSQLYAQYCYYHLPNGELCYICTLILSPKNKTFPKWSQLRGNSLPNHGFNGVFKSGTKGSIGRITRLILLSF